MNIAPFYGFPHAAVDAVEMTITRRATAHGTRWYVAFVSNGVVTISRPDWDETGVMASFVDPMFARIAALADARKYLKQGMTVVWRGDLEC